MKIAIGTVHRNICYSDFRIAVDRLQVPKGTTVVKLNVSGTSIHTQRNQIADATLANDSEGLLFIDDDHVFAANAFLRLLDWNLPFVGGFYVTKTDPHFTSCLIEQGRDDSPDRFRSLNIDEILSGGLVDVDVLGMGFTWIRRDVFEAVRLADLPGWLAVDPSRTPEQYKSWFEMRMPGMHSDFGTDDIAFCLKARNAGFRPVVDTSLKIPHLAVKAVVMHEERVVTCDPMKAIEIAMASDVPVVV